MLVFKALFTFLKVHFSIELWS